jgi:Flp pilus assembly protein TadD
MTTTSVAPPTAASIDEILRKGIASFQSEDWPQALTHFDAAVRSRPHSGEVHNHRARTYEKLGRLDEALECLDRALAIEPNTITSFPDPALM